MRKLRRGRCEPKVIFLTVHREASVVEIDGAEITQSNALTRHIGRMANLYPGDDLQALYCDEVMDAVEDLVKVPGINRKLAEKIYQTLNS